MRFNKITLLFIFSIHSLYVFAQSNRTPEAVVHDFFIAMYETDTAYINSIFYKDASLIRTTFSETQLGKVSMGNASNFSQFVGESKKGDLDERISNLKVEIDGSLANVWMDFSFYYKGQFSHCGVNNITLALVDKSWKIVSLADTNRKTNCIFDDNKVAINKVLDDWHLAATNADSTAYFDLMTGNSVFIGTDKTEVWSKNDFLEFAAPYFARGKAWDFKRIQRNIYSQDFENVAWFDELLDTWMGPCRGSGVMVKVEGKWLVQHYVLSVTVPNDDIKEFLKIYEK